MGKHYPIIVIGGGAAGLLLSSLLPSALIIEKMEEAGKKLLITGKGACNLTHEEDLRVLLSRYYDKKNFVTPAIQGFTPANIRAFFEKRGVRTYVREDGKVFPLSNDAHTIRDSLREANILCSCRTEEIKKQGDTFLIKTSKGDFTSDELILATGGVSYPTTGSEGDGYRFAKALGHRIVPPQAALSQIKVSMSTKELEGISVECAEISIGKEKFTGPLIFTNRGLSGPVALNASREIGSGKEIILKLSSITEEEIRRSNPKSGILTVLHEKTALPKRLIEVQLSNLKDKNIASLSKKDMAEIRNKLLSIPLTASTTGEAKFGMTTRGGVDTSEVDRKTMQSRLCKGLFFAGEILDVDAQCGGYSLTFAFASAYLAAKHVKHIG